MQENPQPQQAFTADYPYKAAGVTLAARYLLPRVGRILDSLDLPAGADRAIDLGCGAGGIADWLSRRGFNVVGVDPSPSGLAHAREAFPHVEFHHGSSHEDLASRFGQFPLLLSIEVIEHVFLPREFMQRVHDLLVPGGYAIISTPYHGYWKNLALAVSNRMDRHFTALWDYGHIKFWSVRSLSCLIESLGLELREIHRVGRVRPFAKSMIALIRRPTDG